MDILNRRAFIDFSSIAENIDILRRRYAPGKRIIAYVKAEGYGHGINDDFLHSMQYVDAFAVASIDEAITLRKLTDKIILFNSAYLSEATFKAARQYNIDIVVHTQFDDLNEFCQPLSRLWIKVNTGMNRMGLTITQAKQILRDNKNKKVILMTHLADSVIHSDENERQLSVLYDIKREFPEVELSFANSARILSQKEMGDWIRPGILLYGAVPFLSQTGAEFGFRPVLTFQARVIAHQHLSAGDSVGYSRQFRAPKDMSIAIVSAGYADGYPRISDGTSYASYQSHQFHIIGHVSMDTLQIASSNEEPLPPIGAWVTLWGDDCPIEKLALATGTSPYELLVNLSNRVERVSQTMGEKIE
tara:strand:+ start:75 stop:1154 length:1080 start_codon:yes stop_codon:yes gene_type:complete